jgi:anthranilate synthase component 2
MTSLLLIDNYDSFTFNLAQELGELGADVRVVRNDAITVDEVLADLPDGLVISPGPGDPTAAGVSSDLIAALAGVRPVLGVCLGHQCLGALYGGEVVRAPELVHGKTSPIHHDGRGVFAGLPQPFVATRYHSLVVDRASVPDVLEVTAWTADGLVMGLRHRTLDVEGVQFHPESILTTDGMDLLANFLRRCAPVSA